MKKIIFLVVLVWLALAVVSCSPKSADQETVSSRPANTSADANVENQKFITANPFNLSQISAISKFRSCVGHDYSGLNANGKEETKRSMKHYLN